MYDKIENFHDYYIQDPANKAYGVLDNLDYVDIGPIRDDIFKAKASVVKKSQPAVTFMIDRKAGPFKSGRVPVGYTTGDPEADKVLQKMDVIIEKTIGKKEDEFLDDLTDLPSGQLIDTHKVRKEIQKQKVIPTGWKDQFPDGLVPWGHKFPDRKINSHNNKLDELILQFGPPAGSMKQQEAQKQLRRLTDLKDADGSSSKELSTLIDDAFTTAGKTEEKAQFWPVEKIRELRNVNHDLGDKNKTAALDKIFTSTKTYTNSNDLWPAHKVVNLRDGLDRSIKSFDRQSLSGWAGDLENLRKTVRHSSKEELANAAERTGKL